MSYWTAAEQHRLIKVHRINYPTADALVMMFPRHDRKAILQMASNLGLRSKKEFWRRIASDHLAKRAKDAGQP